MQSSSVSFLSFSVLGALFLLSLISRSNSAVISIDFSSEWIKIALVKPGVPMEIVLNKESKRKTAAIVALRNDERMFSDAAMSTAIKYPKNAYQYLQFIAGLEYDNPLVKKYMEWFPYYDISRDEVRNTPVFHHSDDLSFTTEELIGMLLNNSRELAQDYAGVPIKNVIITVPAFYTQAQRRSILLAAQLVGLNVLQIMSDSAAAALNYGVFRRNSFNSSATYMMFFDMGATSTIVSIVEYKKVQVKEGGTAHIEPQLAIKGIGFDRTLGGLEMDMRLRDHLAKAFTAKHKTKTPVYQSPRAMAKLLKEARRLKNVLSANADHYAQIEGLHEDIDFSTKVSRADFEEMCADLFDRIEEPIKQALKISEVTMNEIESVLLFGGSTRVPKVQEKLLQTIKRSELGKNLNTDEAAALGAVYQAASLSKLFRVKKFIVKESSVYPIQVSFDKPVVDDEGKPSTKTITRTLFNVGNPYPQKKLLTFNRYNEDFTFSVFYGKMDYLSELQQSYVGPLNLTAINLNGVMEALKENQDGEPGGVKAHFRMNENGILVLDSVQSHFDYEVKEEPSTFSKITNAFSNLFGGSESKEDGEKGDKASEKGEEEKEGTGEGGEAPATETDKKSEEEKKPEQQEENSKETEETKPDDKKDDDKQEEEKQEQQGDDTTEQQKEQPSQDEGERKEEENGEKEETDETTETPDEESNGEEEEFEEDEEEEEESDEEEIPDIDDPSEDAGTKAEEGKPTEPSDDEGATPPPSTDSKQEQPSEVPPVADDSSDGNASNKSTEKVTKKRKKIDDGPKTKTVKVNITADVLETDWRNLTEKEFDVSTTKLQWLQQRDEDKRQNEFAKNSLESHIFEFTDFMYSEEASTFATEDEKTEIVEALRKAGEWLEEEGFNEETDVYKQKLRELKRLSRPLLRRIEEASKRPKLINHLLSSINMSFEFMLRMKNLSEFEILTEVELMTLKNVTKESVDWLLDAETRINATKPHEDPVVLSSEIEEQTRKLDREIMYLMNKVKNFKPKKPKTPANATNTTTNSTDSKTSKTSSTTLNDDDEKKEKSSTDSKDETAQESTSDSNDSASQKKKGKSRRERKAEKENKDKEDEEEETLALPPSGDGDDEPAAKTTATGQDDHTEL